MSDDKGNKVYSENVWAFIELAPDDEPFIVTAEFDKETVAYNETVTATFRIQGGKPPYTIENPYWQYRYENGYFSDRFPVEGEFRNGDSVSFKSTPKTAGEFELMYTAKDAMGRDFYSSTRIPAHGPPALKGRISTEQKNVVYMQTAFATLHIDGGAPPYYARYYLQGYKSDEPLDESGISDWDNVVDGYAIELPVRGFGEDQSDSVRIIALLSDATEQRIELSSDKLQLVIPITSLEITPETLVLLPGQFGQLTISVSPTFANHQEMAWTSNDTNILAVDQTGKVTAKEPGKATITATAKDGSGVSTVCEVTVQKPGLKGDANNDDTIDMKDIVSIINYIVINTECPSIENADTNNDGRVTIEDLFFLVEELVTQ